MSPRAPLPLIVPAPSPVHAAAIVAALERFIEDTAVPPPRNRPSPAGGWLRIARLEAVGSAPQPPAPWGERDPWPATAGAPISNP
jgi:hypothetical protein